MKKSWILIGFSLVLNSCSIFKAGFWEDEPEKATLYTFDFEEETKLEAKKKTEVVTTPDIKVEQRPLHLQDNLETFVNDWIGVPYKYAGNSKQGTDCSGFTTQVYRHVYRHEFQFRRSQDLYSEVHPIKKEELQRGDLVFFKIKGRQIDHVGIYLNQGRFVHASTQKGVIISDLEEPYYKLRFFSGGRVLALAQ
jgi:lipoprotein Spr